MAGAHALISYLVSIPVRVPDETWLRRHGGRTLICNTCWRNFSSGILIMLSSWRSVFRAAITSATLTFFSKLFLFWGIIIIGAASKKNATRRLVHTIVGAPELNAIAGKCFDQQSLGDNSRCLLWRNREKWLAPSSSLCSAFIGLRNACLLLLCWVTLRRDRKSFLKLALLNGKWA